MLRRVLCALRIRRVLVGQAVALNSLDAIFSWNKLPKATFSNDATSVPLTENASMARITATPISALVDEPVKIRVDGLKKHQHVTITSDLRTDHGHLFQSHGYYITDEVGEIDLSRDPSFGGNYDGIEPMGLFWSAKISRKAERPFGRFSKKDVTTPQTVNLSVYDDHLHEDNISLAHPLASLAIERLYMDHTIERIPLRDKDLEGVLFVPKGSGPYPAVIDLRGAIGNVIEFRPSLLACHGFVTLALRYQGYGNYGHTYLEPMKMEYFEQAVKYLANHDKVRGCGVGVMGISTGGAMVAAMAGLFPSLGCSISINGMLYAMERGISYKGKVWEPLFWDSKGMKTINGKLHIKDAFKPPTADEVERYIMPFRLAKSPMMFLISDDDGGIDMDKLVSEVEESMRSAANTNYKIVRYPGAGHLLEPPFTPLVSAIPYSKELLTPVNYGGETKGHARAQEDAWKRIIYFLKLNLSPEATKKAVSKL